MVYRIVKTADLDGKHPFDVWQDYLARPKGYALRWALWDFEAQEHEKRMKAITKPGRRS
jgi:hypothetical protein